MTTLRRWRRSNDISLKVTPLSSLLSSPLLSSHPPGEPVICIIRILHQFVDRPEAVEHLAGASVDAIKQLTRTIDPRPDASHLPKEAAFMCELIKKIYQHRPMFVRSMDHLVAMALDAHLPHFLLEGGCLMFVVCWFVAYC